MTAGRLLTASAMAQASPDAGRDVACEQRPTQALPVKLTAARPRTMVSADSQGLVSQARTVLFVEAMQVTGLDLGLQEALGRWRAEHDLARSSRT